MNNVNMHIFKRQTVTFILNMSSVFILSIYPIPINKLVNVNVNAWWKETMPAALLAASQLLPHQQHFLSSNVSAIAGLINTCHHLGLTDASHCECK